MKETPNATTMEIDIVGSSTFGRYSKISNAQTWNMFISDDAQVNFAGWKKAFDLLPSGSGRALFNSLRGNFFIAVVNSQIFKIDQELFPTIVGTITTSAGEVYIDENLNQQICLVDGANAYIYNYGDGSFGEVTVSGMSPTPLKDIFTPGYVSFNNTFFNFGNATKNVNGALWYTYQGSAGQALIAVSNQPIQTKPDFALAVVRLPGQSSNVLVLGSNCSEIWTNVGGLQNYRKNSTLSIDYGCASISTIAFSEEIVCWLAINENNSPVIAAYSSGQGLQTISTDGIDYQLGQIKFPAQSTAMFYRQDGHLFYQITFYNDADNKTLAYDFNTQKFFQLSDSNMNHHPAQNFVIFNGKTYFLSLNNASLYESSSNFVDHNENQGTLSDPSQIFLIPFERVCSPARDDQGSRFIANLLTVQLEQGADTHVTQLEIDNYDIFMVTEDAFPDPNEPIITENGANIVSEESWKGAPVRNNPVYRPRVDLSLSYDGGVTWSNWVSKELNPVGKRKNQLTWNGLGMANDLTLRFRFWGRSRWVILSATLDVYR